MRDPERPAFLQVLRAHEIGGRPIPDLLDAITAEPLEGSRSIAAVLHGRAGKEPAPARGATAGWAERAPGDVTPAIETAGEMLDARQAALGERLAANPPAWALRAWGDPRAKTGAERADWEQLAAIVESYREAAGITDPEQATGPVPSGKAHLAEAFRASVRALRLPDEAALLRAMNRGQLEARVQEYIRAEAVAPPDVQAEAGDREHSLEEARTRGGEAQLAGDVAAAEDAETEAAGHAENLARLSAADAARREWREATAAQEAAAREAAAELGRRGPRESEAEFLERLDRMVNGAEATQEAQAGAETEAQAAPEAESEAGFPGRLPEVVAEAEARQAAHAEAAAGPQAEPGDVDPELVRQAGEDLDADPVRAKFLDDMAEIRAGNERLGELVDRMPDRQAEQRAQMEQEIRDEPGIRPPQAEAQAGPESSWQPGEAGRHHEASAEAEADMEMEP
jgi:hypothetical protein